MKGLLPICTGIFFNFSENAKQIGVEEVSLEILEEQDIFPSSCSILGSLIFRRVFLSLHGGSLSPPLFSFLNFFADILSGDRKGDIHIQSEDRKGDTHIPVKEARYFSEYLKCSLCMPCSLNSHKDGRHRTDQFLCVCT